MENNCVSTVDVGVLTFTKNRKLAEKFVEFAASQQGRAIFKKHLYRVEPP
jgi:ABC-type molybdate transport system substrate-binding protein